MPMAAAGRSAAKRFLGNVVVGEQRVAGEQKGEWNL